MSWMIISQIIVPILTLVNTCVLGWLVFFSGKKKDTRQEGEDIGRIKQHCISTDKNMEEVKTDFRTLSDKVERKLDDMHKSIDDKTDSLRKESEVAHEKIGENINTLRSETKQDIKTLQSETKQEISETRQEIGKSEERLSKSIEDLKSLLTAGHKFQSDGSDKTN